jgi:hypothetical protein
VLHSQKGNTNRGKRKKLEFLYIDAARFYVANKGSKCLLAALIFTPMAAGSERSVELRGLHVREVGSESTTMRYVLGVNSSIKAW